MLKSLFLVLFNDHFSVHKSEKSKFIALIHKEYFHLGIFVIPMPNQKIWVPNHGIFSVQGVPERSRQSNLAVFAVEGGLDSKFPHVK